MFEQVHFCLLSRVSAALHTCSFNWRRTGRTSANVSWLICVFGGTPLWIFTARCDWILSMKWKTALLETYLPQDTNQKSTYCSVHADTSAAGSNLQAMFVQVRRFKLISVWSHMVSAITETLLWFYALIQHLVLIIWFHVFGRNSDCGSLCWPKPVSFTDPWQAPGAPSTRNGRRPRTLWTGTLVFPDTLK